MNNKTPEQKYSRLIIAALVVVIITLLWYTCNGKRSEGANNAYASIRDTLMYLLADNARVNAIARGLKQENEDLDNHIADLVADRDMIRESLYEESDRANRLADEVKRAKAQKDTAKYFSNCDSLSDVVQYYKGWMEEVWRYETKHDSLQNLRISKADSLASHWERSYINCMGAVTFTNTELPKVKPRGQLTAYAIGAVAGPIIGVGGSLDYRFKNGISLRADGLATNYGLVAVVGFGVPLTPKRK